MRTTTPILTAALLATVLSAATAQTVVKEVGDDDFVAGVDYTLFADTIYQFGGLVYLEEGASLTIEPGTVLWFEAGQAADASALIVTRGAQIFAEGTADAPIIMTYEGDNVDDDADLDDPETTRGSWGGLVILGRANVSLNDPEEGFDGRFGQIEGIDPNEPRARYGVDSGDPIDDDDSGVLRYVSVRHAGSVFGSGDEINGITLGGVGSGTTIEFVEVFANLDDGIEFFGGTVDVKNALVSYCGDDSFDYDLGYRGRGQYWVSLSGTDVVGRAAEWDGAIPDDNTPFAQVTLANATFVGPGFDTTGIEGDQADFAIVIRDGAGANVYNSVVTNFPLNAVNVEDLETDAGVDSYQRLVDGDVDFAGNVFGNFGRPDGSIDSLIRFYDGGDDPDGSETIAEFADGNAFVGDGALLASVSGTDFDPRPADGSELVGNAIQAALPDTAFFDEVDYIGAFPADSTQLWIKGWTALDHYGLVADVVSSARSPLVAEASIALTPNPALGGATLTYVLDEDADVRIGLFNVNGQRVSGNAARLAAGPQRTYVDADGLPAGTYVVRIVAGGGVAAKTLVVR